MIQDSDLRNKLISTIEAKDREIDTLFNQIIEESNASEKLDQKVVLSTEYLIYKIRLLISSESFSIKRLLSMSDIPPITLGIIKRRETVLNNILLRIGEIESTIALINKIEYSLKFKS